MESAILIEHVIVIMDLKEVFVKLVMIIMLVPIVTFYNMIAI